MATYRITENDIKGMEVLATGYKCFKNDWTSKHGDYSYADENGEVLNSIHKVDGELVRCENGLHFSRNPLDCFKYYESVQWNRFAKVEAYGELIDEEDKSIARILKIIKTYTFDEFINEIKETNNHIRGGNDIYGGNGIRGGNDIYGGTYIYGARNCEGVSKCIFCYQFTGKLHAFNKPITEERFEEIWDNLNDFNWTPDFTNANKLKGNKEWEETNIPEIKGVSNKEAWSTMPDEMKAYIKSLPEFDEAIFKAITED